ncbi:hypothetical protein ABT56_19915 [Photobacterium aquae]|uniref:Autotransporter domain-containing protein n=1 Tax=Photobacterium aquae TaxID=1195763 RepID=A0A0J1GUI9_9GAMM|nr:autotransporter outer membrane beta-barrel domain-containing protein [Photobacterium aquae]KLV03388.1 hypothetical protein ABT56_19915 [Photobacterium aquae]
MLLSKQATSRCLPVTLLVVIWGADAKQESESSTLGEYIPDDMYAAVSSMISMADSVRGDRVDKKVRTNLRRSSPGLRTAGMAERASSTRNATHFGNSNLGSMMSPSGSSPTIPSIHDLPSQKSAQFGGYVRLENRLLGGDPNRPNQTNEQEYSGYSLTLGGDYLFREHYLFGMTLGLPFYKPMSETNDTEVDGLIASGYFSYLQDSWYLDFNASYAVMDTDIERQVTLYTDTVVNNTNEADSDIWLFSVGGGYIFEYNYLNIALESSLQYTLSDSDRYQERSALTSSNYLFSQIDDVDALQSTMLISGISLSHPFRTSVGIFQPYAKGYVHYDIAPGKQSIISQLKSNHSGSILPIVVETDDQLYGRMHLGISGAFNEDWFGYIEASSLLWHDDISAHTVSFGVSMSLD